tara:strand:+ start:2168 stop:2494 length:327 start_codon:yes stop_codon:yes gene_type:complete
MTDVIKFPIKSIVRSVQNDLPDEDHEKIRTIVVDAIDEVKGEIINNDDINGVVILAFEGKGKIPKTYNWFAGDLGLSNVYLTLDKLKMELIDVINGMQEKNEDNEEGR